MTTEQSPHRPPASSIPLALADLRDMLEDVSQAMSWLTPLADDDPITASEVRDAQIVLRQRLAHHAEAFHDGLRLGYVRFATIDGPQFWNASIRAFQEWKSPGALCTQAEAEEIMDSTTKRNETVEIYGIKTPRGWTAFEPKNKEA